MIAAGPTLTRVLFNLLNRFQCVNFAFCGTKLFRADPEILGSTNGGCVRPLSLRLTILDALYLMKSLLGLLLVDSL